MLWKRRPDRRTLLIDSRRFARVGNYYFFARSQQLARIILGGVLGLEKSGAVK